MGIKEGDGGGVTDNRLWPFIVVHGRKVDGMALVALMHNTAEARPSR
jgi:hypothetical protein